MYYFTLLVTTFILITDPIICKAQNSQMPSELVGIWISKDVSKNDSGSGGAILEKGEKEGLCRSLAKNLYFSHNFEGVVVLRSDKMIMWDVRCDIFGGFKKRADTYTSNWRCRGEHGTFRGRVTFHLATNGSETTLIRTLTYDQGSKFTDYYDDKCK